MNPDRLNELKEEYNQIHADDAYKERLANMMKKEHTKRSIWKKTAAAALRTIIKIKLWLILAKRLKRSGKSISKRD